MSDLTDLNSTLKGVVQNLSQAVIALQAAFPRINGTFILTASATASLVAQPAISASSIVDWTPTNSAAALLLRSQGLYLSARTAGASFVVSTQTGTPTGTEAFSYIVVNPS